MKMLVIVLIVAAVYCGYEFFRIKPLVAASEELVERARPFTKEEGTKNMLFLGDSVAVGVGASRPEESLAGRIAANDSALAIENYAVSGARIAQLRGQFEKAKKERYDGIVVQIGANDAIRFQGAETSAQQLEPVLRDIAQRSDSVILVMAGNIGGARFFPYILHPFYRYRSLQYHAAFQKLADHVDVTYVNLYTPPAEDVFVLEPGTYLSADGLHPSSEGYRVWYEKVSPHL